MLNTNSSAWSPDKENSFILDAMVLDIVSRKLEKLKICITMTYENEENTLFYHACKQSPRPNENDLFLSL